jgi:hypothetical protein
MSDRPLSFATAMSRSSRPRLRQRADFSAETVRIDREVEKIVQSGHEKARKILSDPARYRPISTNRWSGRRWTATRSTPRCGS